MSPRRYCLGQRQLAADETRSCIIAASRRLLTGRRGVDKFSMDAVAKKSGVAKMTLYHQFGSKRELLEALFDDLGARSLVCHMGGVFESTEPLDALEKIIGVFANFWTVERLVIRRINSLAATDPIFAEGLAARDQRRRYGFTNVLSRIAEKHGQPAQQDFEETLRLVMTLTSFQTFDSLAGPDRTPNDVAPTIHQLVLTSLQLPSSRSKKPARR